MEQRAGHVRRLGYCHVVLGLAEDLRVEALQGGRGRIDDQRIWDDHQHHRDDGHGPAQGRSHPPRGHREGPGLRE